MTAHLSNDPNYAKRYNYSGLLWIAGNFRGKKE
jgi:hypothetical protein